MSEAMAGEWTRRQFVAGLTAAGVVAGGGVPALAICGSGGGVRDPSALS